MDKDVFISHNEGLLKRRKRIFHCDCMSILRNVPAISHYPQLVFLPFISLSSGLCELL